MISFVEFTLPGPLRESLQERSLAAVFGTMDGTVLRGQRVFPKANVILVPKEESSSSPGDNSAASGDVPVVLRLGRRFFTSCRKHTG